MENWFETPYRSMELDISDIDRALPVLHALSTELRLRIVRELSDGALSVNELARALDVPVSTAALNVQILEKAGVLACEMRPGTRGVVKLCAQRVTQVSMNLERRSAAGGNVSKFEMPVGCYSTVDGIRPPCGLADYERKIEMDDAPGTFYHPWRFEAELLWMQAGEVEYRFPSVARDRQIEFLEISYEACSEVRGYRNDYPSDIFTSINGVQLGVWRSPGDFGGRRGFLNPDWWRDTNTQFGRLLCWRVQPDGTWLDDVRISGVTLNDLRLNDYDSLRLAIGVFRGNGIAGGMNLFGKRFGDYPQGIVLRCGYK